MGRWSEENISISVRERTLCTNERKEVKEGRGAKNTAAVDWLVTAHEAIGKSIHPGFSAMLPVFQRHVAYKYT